MWSLPCSCTISPPLVEEVRWPLPCSCSIQPPLIEEVRWSLHCSSFQKGPPRRVCAFAPSPRLCPSVTTLGCLCPRGSLHDTHRRRLFFSFIHSLLKRLFSFCNRAGGGEKLGDVEVKALLDNSVEICLWLNWLGPHFGVYYSSQLSFPSVCSPPKSCL